jgi:uncharacterized phage-associated protein
MTLSVFDAAQYLCKKSNWTLSNLQLQKILYICHMFHLGREGTPLIREEFEAWDYGPVQPNLYHELKVYGSAPVKSLFHSAIEITEESSEKAILDSVYQQLPNHSPAWLVAVTHWDKGAWSKFYKPGSKGIRIPNSEIALEFKARVAANEQRAA